MCPPHSASLKQIQVWVCTTSWAWPKQPLPGLLPTLSTGLPQLPCPLGSGAAPPRETVLADQHGQVERHPANQSLHGSAMFKCHPVPRCLRITIIRGCSLKIRAQFFKKQIAQSDVLAAVRNIYGLRACAVSSSLSLYAGDGPTAPWAQPGRDEDARLPTAGSLCPLTSPSTSGRVCP